MVTIVESGVETKLTAEEAFLRKLLSDGGKGNSSAAMLILEAIEEESRLRDIEKQLQRNKDFCVRPVPRGSVAHHLTNLRIIRKFDRFRETSYFRIEPKAIEDALARFGDRRLSVEEQRIVFKR